MLIYVFREGNRFRNTQDKDDLGRMIGGASRPHLCAGQAPISTSHAPPTLTTFLHPSKIEWHLVTIRSDILSHGAIQGKILTSAASQPPYINNPMPTSKLIPFKPSLLSIARVLSFSKIQ
jgi:hypothetical protein